MANENCSNCGWHNDIEATTCPECGRPLSVADDTLEALVSQASVPNLALLFKQAKKAGHLKPVSDYGQPVR